MHTNFKAQLSEHAMLLYIYPNQAAIIIFLFHSYLYRYRSFNRSYEKKKPFNYKSLSKIMIEDKTFSMFLIVR